MNIAQSLKYLILYACNDCDNYNYKLFREQMSKTINQVSLIHDPNIYENLTGFAVSIIEKEIDIKNKSKYSFLKNDNEFYFVYSFSHTHKVDINCTTCNCGLFVSSGIICRHLIFMREQLSLF